jgi:hypothetical protein
MFSATFPSSGFLGKRRKSWSSATSVIAVTVFVRKDADGWRMWMVGERGVIHAEEVQLARLEGEEPLGGGAP